MASLSERARNRDAGLVRGIGLWPLTGAFVGMLVGSGIFNVPGAMAAAVGPFAPLAYLVCGLAVGAVLLCFAEGVSRVPTSAGVGGFVGAAFGPYWGFVTGVLNWAAAVVASGGIGAAIIDIIATIAPALGAGPVRAAALLLWFFGLAGVNIIGVDFAARLVTIATSIKLVPLTVFVAVGVWFIDPAMLVAPVAAGSSDIGRAAILGIFLFTGIEASLAVSGEVRDPVRTVPRAIIITVIAYAALCIAVQLVAQGLLGPALGSSKAPLPDAMATVSPLLQLLLAAGGAISMLGWTASDALSSPRMLFALGRDGFLPAAFGRLHPRRATPWVASLAHAAIAAGLAISGNFATLAVASALIAIVVYVLGCAAAVKLRRDDVALAGPPLRIAGLLPLALIGSATMLWVAAQSSAAEAYGIIALIAVISLLYLLRRQKALASA
jgi:amino acid transporter